MSLAVLAERTGTTAATISRVENDKQTPSYALIRRLHRVTGIATDSFLDRVCDDRASPAA